MQSETVPKQIMSATQTAPMVTGLCWKPNAVVSAFGPGSSSTSKQNTFKAVTSDGRILQWSPLCKNSIEVAMVNENNSYQCIDYSPEGSKFVCAGKQPYPEVYDEETLKQIYSILPVDSHRNKIFCVKFDCEDPNIFFSGGWDRLVNIWDLRVSGKKVGQIGGPVICGEAIDNDPRSYKLLTGSHTKTESLQLWDLRTLGSLQTVPWSVFKSTESAMTMTYSAKFIKPKRCSFLACGVNKHSAKIFSAMSGNQLYSFVDCDETLGSQPLVVVDTTNDGRMAVIGEANGRITMQNLQRFDLKSSEQELKRRSSTSLPLFGFESK